MKAKHTSFRAPRHGVIAKKGERKCSQWPSRLGRPLLSTMGGHGVEETLKGGTATRASSGDDARARCFRIDEIFRSMRPPKAWAAGF